MFEVGKTYRFEWLEGPDHTYQSGDVIVWEAPLLKVRFGGSDKIINTSSRTFVSASDRTGAPDVTHLIGGFDDR